jgi:hypothetical protein
MSNHFGCLNQAGAATHWWRMEAAALPACGVNRAPVFGLFAAQIRYAGMPIDLTSDLVHD